jgi:hypothetical protein
MTQALKARLSSSAFVPFMQEVNRAFSAGVCAS